MQLAIFDIDGTLTQTPRVDDECYLRAVAEVFGIEGVNDDWSAYEHCTDVAIAGQLVRERTRRECASAEMERLRDRFLALLGEALARDGSLFAPVPGAAALLRSMRGPAPWSAALATGGFESSARLKLHAARINVAGLPGAFAEDGPSREQIVRAAIDRALARHGRDSFDRMVSIGDGVWDVRTAAGLGLPFVGIGAGQREARLRAAGATTILPDFSDESRVAAALDHAEAPVGVDRTAPIA